MWAGAGCAGSWTDNHASRSVRGAHSHCPGLSAHCCVHQQTTHSLRRKFAFLTRGKIKCTKTEQSGWTRWKQTKSNRDKVIINNIRNSA